MLGYIPDIFGNPSFLSTRGFGNFAVRQGKKDQPVSGMENESPRREKPFLRIMQALPKIKKKSDLPYLGSRRKTGLHTDAMTIVESAAPLAIKP